MPKIIVPGRRLTADVTHKIQPMITVQDTTGREWFARAMFLSLDRGTGDNWKVEDFSLSIAAKENYAFYKNTKLGVEIRLDQNPELKKLVNEYVSIVKKTPLKPEPNFYRNSKNRTSLSRKVVYSERRFFYDIQSVRTTRPAGQVDENARRQSEGESCR